MYPLHPNEERLIFAAKQANKYFEFLGRQKKKYSSWKEYNQDLNIWFQQTYRIWNLTAKFPYFLAYQQVALRHRQTASATNSATTQPTTTDSTTTQPTNQQRPRTTFQQPQSEFEGVECQVPAIWKRLAAEVIDFFILFFIKVACTFMAIDFYDFIDLDMLGLTDDFFFGDAKVEYKAVLQLTHSFVILELIHRIVVTMFETYWLMGSGSPERIGGASPGKSLMGLRVIRCELTSDLQRIPGTDPNGPQRIHVIPGTDLGLQASFLRALIKNLVLTFFIPASLALLYFRHNRIGYDILCNTIVVEEPIIRHRRTNANTNRTNPPPQRPNNNNENNHN